MKRIFFLSLIACFLFAADAIAGKRWWISNTTSNWNNTGNWSSISATGASGAAVPGSSDTIYFTSSRTGQCTLDVAASVKRWEMGSGCGTFSQGTYSLTVGTSGAVLSGGTFTGGSGTITFSGACTISGTAFTSTSAAFSTNSNFTLSSGSFTHNGGTMKFTASCTISASVTFAMDTMEFSPTAHAGYTISGAGTINVEKLLRYSSSYQIAVSSGTINVQGDITLNNTFSGNSAGGTATIVINGSNAQYINGTSVIGQSRLPSLTINKSSGTLYLVSFISTQGANFTYQNGTVDAGTSTFWFAGNKTFSGSIELNIVAFGASVSSTYTINSGTVITADSTVQILGSTNAIFNTGTIYAKDHISITNTATGGGGTASLIINGDGAQTLTGSGTAGQGRLPNITVDKSGTLTLSSIISVDGSWTYTAGTVSPGTSTVAFYGTYNLDGQEAGSAACMPFYNVTINGGTRTLTGHLDCNNNFTISSGTTCSAGSNTIYVGGDWNSAGTWTYGTSTVVFDGSGYNKVQGAGTGAVNFANVQLTRRTTGGGTAKNLRLLNPMKINTSMTFNKGRIYSTTTNYLEFADDATCTMNNNDSAYVHGPVRKTGNDAFAFPLGDTTLHDSIAYHPLAITAPGSTSDRFEAQYYAIAQTVGDSLVDSLADISAAEYWRLDRQVGSSDVTPTLHWNRNSSNVVNYNNLRVANWNNTKWLDLGGTGITINGWTGSVTAVTVPTYVSGSALLTIANTNATEDYAILHRKLDGGYYVARNGALYFMYDEEYYDTDGDLTFTIYDEQRRTVASSTGTYAIAEPSVYGDNRFYINLFDCSTNANGYVGSGTYILEVSNEKGEKWLLRFKHVTTITPNCPGGGGGGE